MSLISDSILPAGHSRQCFPQVFGTSVSQRCWNQFWYLFHSLFCSISVRWHSCSTESSAWPIQDLPHPSLHPFVSFMVWLWGFSTALKNALTCSTFCLVCIGGRSSMVSVDVSLVVPSMTLIALLCTLALPLFLGLVCSQCHWAPHSDTVGRDGIVQYPLHP